MTHLAIDAFLQSREKIAIRTGMHGRRRHLYQRVSAA